MATVAFVCAALALGAQAAKKPSHWRKSELIQPKFNVSKYYTKPHRHFLENILAANGNELPESYNPCSQNLCTPSLNQHIPQYCGSCWAHAAISVISDRMKKMRVKQGDLNPDVVLSVQHVLNCPYIDVSSHKAMEESFIGSCYGGSVVGAFALILERFSKDPSECDASDEMCGKGLAYFTNSPYLACSADSSEGFCGAKEVQEMTSCSVENIARTCSTFKENGGDCVGINEFPSVHIKDVALVPDKHLLGTTKGYEQMKLELYHHGPIMCGLDAEPIIGADGKTVIEEEGEEQDHVIEIVGWENDSWIVRNSWGEYWGEMGFIKVKFGSLKLDDSQCAAAYISHYTSAGNQIHFSEDGVNLDKEGDYNKKSNWGLPKNGGSKRLLRTKD